MFFIYIIYIYIYDLGPLGLSHEMATVFPKYGHDLVVTWEDSPTRWFSFSPSQACWWNSKPRRSCPSSCPTSGQTTQKHLKKSLVVLGRGHSQDMANRSALLKSSRLCKYSHVNTYAEQTISNRASICRNTDSCKYDTRIGGVEIVWKTCKCQMAAIQRFPVIFHLYCPNEKVDRPTLPHIAKLKIENSKICTLWLWLTVRHG